MISSGSGTDLQYFETELSASSANTLMFTVKIWSLDIDPWMGSRENNLQYIFIRWKQQVAMANIRNYKVFTP